jgi:dihydroflavonol-4-reductase
VINCGRIYLLNGAAGNLGSNISRTLIAAGETVRALVLNGDPAIDRVPREAEICSGDVLDVPSLERFFNIPETMDIYVIHCASIVALEANFSQKVHDVNITGTRNILDQCIKHKVRKLVYISSTSAIPELPGTQPIIEVSQFDQDQIVGYYGKSKAEASQMVMDAVKLYDLDASIVFPSGIVGPYDYGFGLVTSNIINFAKGKIPGGLTGSFNCADVRDLADGVVSCCSKGRKGEGYILGNKTVTVQELFDTIADACGGKRVRIFLPASVATGLAIVSEAICKVTKKSTILTRFTIYNLLRNNNYSSEKAVRELGYRFRPFSETIRDEVQWLREEGRI